MLGNLEFLGTYAELRKVTISFIMFVHLSAWNSRDPTGQILMKFYTGVFLSNVTKIQVLLKLDKNN